MKSKRIEGMRLEHLSQTLPEQAMSPDQKKKRQVKFRHQFQVLSFKKKQAVNKLLGCGKEKILLHGEEEFTKKRRYLKKGANRSPLREGIKMVPERQKDIEVEFWAAHILIANRCGQKLGGFAKRSVMGVVTVK